MLPEYVRKTSYTPKYEKTHLQHVLYMPEKKIRPKEINLRPNDSVKTNFFDKNAKRPIIDL